MESRAISPPVLSGQAPATWLSAWPDALALAGGLALAWLLHWQVRDLVWSLWLSSLLVGYAMIVWKIFGPVVVLSRRKAASDASAGLKAAGFGLYLGGGLFMLAFFTFHFGMFHFVHSIFLNMFFPALDGARHGGPSLSLYAHVVASYWPFVVVAAVAERNAFRLPSVPPLFGTEPAAASRRPGGTMMEPYRNVVRMHLLIFFFAFAHFARLENFVVYAVVYAVYFFPWRLARAALRRKT